MYGNQRINLYLGQVIQDLIHCKLQLNYCCNLEVRDILHCDCYDGCDECDNIIGYELRIGNPKLPGFISLVRYGTEQEFIDFCLEELRNKHLERIKHYSVKLVYDSTQNKCGTNQQD